MTSICGNTFPSHSVPYLSSLVKGSGGNFGAIGNIEAHTINCIFMAFKRVDKVSRAGVPYLAGSIVAASDELIPVLVEAAVSQRQHMSF